MTTDASPALLTKTELDWLQHKIKVSKVYEYRLKSDIKKKLQTFQQLELPLLMRNGFISSANDLSIYTQSLSANPQRVESSSRARIQLSQKKQALAGIWTRDLCLTKATLYQAELPRHHNQGFNMNIGFH
jgi:hypothetical protein